MECDTLFSGILYRSILHICIHYPKFTIRIVLNLVICVLINDSDLPYFQLFLSLVSKRNEYDRHIISMCVQLDYKHEWSFVEYARKTLIYKSFTIILQFCAPECACLRDLSRNVLRMCKDKGQVKSEIIIRDALLIMLRSDKMKITCNFASLATDCRVIDASRWSLVKTFVATFGTLIIP